MKAPSAFLAFLAVVAISAPVSAQVIAQEAVKKPQNPGKPAGARVLDLSKVPVVIDEPGVYVLDRNWSFENSVPGGVVLTINARSEARSIVLDLQDFGIHYCTFPFERGTTVHIRGAFVTLHNGTVSGCDVAVLSDGNRTRLRDMEFVGGVSLAGTSAELVDSAVHLGPVVVRGTEATVGGNRIRCNDTCMMLQGDKSHVSNNILDGSHRIIEIEGSLNLISGNTLYREGRDETIVLRGDHNVVRNNTFIQVQRSGTAPVIGVYGTGNTLDGNIAPPVATFGNVASSGIVFRRDGNFFGDNRMAASVPFDLGGTVQTDWGANRGY